MESKAGTSNLFPLNGDRHKFERWKLTLHLTHPVDLSSTPFRPRGEPKGTISKLKGVTYMAENKWRSQMIVRNGGGVGVDVHVCSWALVEYQHIQ
jgi:hypothetical protein